MNVAIFVACDSMDESQIAQRNWREKDHAMTTRVEDKDKMKSEARLDERPMSAVED